MKIYYLKYYKGNIKIEEISAMSTDKKYRGYSHTLLRIVEFNIEDEAEVLEYSLGDIRIWITEKGSLKLATKKLVDYAELFHQRSIQRHRKRIEEEDESLSKLYDYIFGEFIKGEPIK